MNRIEQLHKSLKKTYDSGDSPLNELRDIALLCTERLIDSEQIIYPHGAGKSYTAYTNGSEISRPVRSDLFIGDIDRLSRQWDALICSINSGEITTSASNMQINSVVYTAVVGFAACYDIWKKSSRKTPGTHFEVLLGSLISQFLPDFERSKFISLPGQNESVSTDIVFGRGIGGIVIPAKITTRERIVQPYAHQRILDSIFPPGTYKSVLLCVSETQRDDIKTVVNDICVPGTIKLFQAHLAKLNAIYYLDPPGRYLAADVTSLLKVSDYGEFFRNDLAQLAMPLR